jgi:hypothetical protein
VPAPAPRRAGHLRAVRCQDHGLLLLLIESYSYL